ncbi:MAG: arylesterase [Candidatus Muproteobacteria bacterium RBG_16_65_34]|uniref:Arylesterase n=1 Tax=Candidatus Muproteobacteria bacterium RBG_16_65_34 TaxID=1817760 RepID=A0A1F6TP94_9PROT|nr:MAG: arylesterase [Candidatus Muproteobacteria bacterium RBG_16_65_34]
MRRVLVAVLVVVCIVPAEALARTILVVGDSLSAAHGMDLRAGWVSLLRERLAAQKLDYQVVNAAVSGDITANALARLPRLLTEHRPDIVILELGGNDGLRGLSPAQMKHNLSVMIANTKAAGAKVLLVGIELPPNYGRKYTERFRRVYRELAAEPQVTLVPSIMEGFATDRSLMQPDGIHPNAKAQPRMLENVWGQLRALL